MPGITNLFVDDLFGLGGNEMEQRVLSRLRIDCELGSEDWIGVQEDFHCTPSMHTVYRSLMGRTNWLQSWTQFQCCYFLSRRASMAASPTMGDVKSPNKLARQIKSQPVKLQYWLH